MQLKWTSHNSIWSFTYFNSVPVLFYNRVLLHCNVCVTCPCSSSCDSTNQRTRCAIYLIIGLIFLGAGIGVTVIIELSRASLSFGICHLSRTFGQLDNLLVFTPIIDFLNKRLILLHDAECHVYFIHVYFWTILCFL
jgi:hypothetical protein